MYGVESFLLFQIHAALCLIEKLTQRMRIQNNKPAKIDAVVELVLLLPLVAAAALTQIDGSTHEQKSWHDDRKDFLDPGRHVMRRRGPLKEKQENQ